MWKWNKIFSKKEKFIKDFDADGLTDKEERKLGTDPFKKDTDKDGLADYEEVNVYKTNPLEFDTDKDGVSDGQEIKMGRNPLGPGRLKDFFVPHKGNNYHPQALHSQRLFFYAISSAVIKFVVVVFLLIMPVSAWLTPDVLKEQSKKIIKLTNEVRQDLSINILEESESLDKIALYKAEDMLLNQYFAHVSPEEKRLSDWLEESSYDYRVAGENLAMGFMGAEDVVNAWVKSKTHYDNIIEPRYNKIGVGMVSGEYNGYESTLVAQYFASPPDSRGDVEDNIKLKIDFLKSKLIVKDEKQKNKKKVEAVVYVEGEAKKVTVDFNNYHLDLKKEGMGKWIGSVVIFNEKEEELFNPVILGSVIAYDGSGNSVSGNINWDNITPVKPSLLKQYFFMKYNQSEYIKPLFSISSIYYKILVALASVILLVNIFVEIKRQNPKVIFSTLGLIGLLMVLIYV